jgi:type IV pilus assembly protein PilQ
VLRLLSEVGHANIVVADGVSGRVTIRMKHVPWDQALDVVARAKGLAIERDGGVMLVTHP